MTPGGKYDTGGGAEGGRGLSTISAELEIITAGVSTVNGGGRKANWAVKARKGDKTTLN